MCSTTADAAKEEAGSGQRHKREGTVQRLEAIAAGTDAKAGCGRCTVGASSRRREESADVSAGGALPPPTHRISQTERGMRPVVRNGSSDGGWVGGGFNSALSAFNHR